MHWKPLLSIVLALFVSAAGPGAGHASPFLASNPAHSGSADEFEIFERINRERARFKLGELEWDDKAAELATSYSARMARDNFFDHVDPDGNSVVERASIRRLRGWSMIGENLFMCEAYDNFLPLAVSGWLKSPSHRQNILDRRWTATGVGIARGRQGRIFVTQIFLESF